MIQVAKKKLFHLEIYLVYENNEEINVFCLKQDPNANEQFIKINRAYEILKDEELRKKYDAYGEDGLKDNQNQGHNYQSWNFYHQNFGIYDDDIEIITLTRSDFSN